MRSIRDYLDGFMAWDHGATDSGIHDPVCRGEIQAHLRRLADDQPEECREILWPFLVDWPSEYGIEDLAERLNWLQEFLGFDDWSGL